MMFHALLGNMPRQFHWADVSVAIWEARQIPLGNSTKFTVDRFDLPSKVGQPSVPLTNLFSHQPRINRLRFIGEYLYRVL
jgi:hypothetical protein